ncbi:Osmotin, thaumatin-like protein [Auricularia subglabra TFB-10046 SS5]|uniref:Osmotin, thaumatin-like protein n=1 Tax=Auricularia subglabra (strain TFB-10046 / SS5) TaxID=717982 RepID=J0D8C2_AURST|nr:Osmotin, thaumatin-like protein [Auricularia subglabra TFB-10046 SS5]
MTLVAAVSARTVTVVNACPFTIWPAVYTDPSRNPGPPAGVPAGWEAPAGSSKSFSVPDGWKSGTIWARRECAFNNASLGEQQCATGGCPGGLECTGIGAPPVTLTEFNLDDNTVDWVDVSLVNGFNLPVHITNNQGCPESSCPIDLNSGCPAPLIGPVDSAGTVLGCNSACSANLDGTPQDSANCCTGSHSTPAECPAHGVQYYDYFKSRCPQAHAFAYDAPSSPLICSASRLADYTITFCP